MAIADAYATAAQYRETINKSLTADDTEVLRQLTSISRMIERECGRIFNKDAAATVRLYTPSDCELLEVDDLVSVTSIKVDVDGDLDFTTDDALTVSTDYELLPLNAATGAEPEPYTQIRRVDEAWPGTTSIVNGRTAYSRVRVEGIHGWPAVPGPIVEATIWLTAILRLETPRATSRIDEAGTVVGTSRSADQIIERLKATYMRAGVGATSSQFFVV